MSIYSTNFPRKCVVVFLVINCTMNITLIVFLLQKSRELSNISRELQQQKRHYQRHKGRWEAELTRVTSQSNEQLDTAKNQLEDLKRALRQLRREKYSAKVRLFPLRCVRQIFSCDSTL